MYRRIFRSSNLFVWEERARGPLEGPTVRERPERVWGRPPQTDPELIARLLVGGSGAVQAATDKFLAKRSAVMDGEAGPVVPGGGGSGAAAR